MEMAPAAQAAGAFSLPRSIAAALPVEGSVRRDRPGTRSLFTGHAQAT
jgi:hypothetical protein